MAGQKITSLLTSNAIHDIGSGLWYNTITIETAKIQLKDTLLALENHDILCDITTTENAWEELQSLSLDEIIANWEYIEYAIKQIREVFLKKWNKDNNYHGQAYKTRRKPA